MKKRKDSFITGTGPTINNVTIQYSCGEKGMKNNKTSIVKERKGMENLNTLGHH